MRAVRVPCIRLWLVSGQVWDAHIHCSAQRENRAERPGELFPVKVAPGRASLLRIHNEPGLWAWNYCRQLHTRGALIRRNPAQGHQEMSRVAPGSIM